VSIGDGCVIGAGSVVTKSVPAYHLAVGVPARVLRKVAPDVPDAPSLLREIDDDLLAVCDSIQVRGQENKDSSQRGTLSRVRQWGVVGRAEGQILSSA
jgi:tetrahydrodipicolinate N-succinyltransferase